MAYSFAQDKQRFIDRFRNETCRTLPNGDLDPAGPSWAERQAAAKRLLTLAAQYARIQLSICNDDPSRYGPGWEEQREKREDKIEKDIRDLCARFPGVRPIFSGDPRGACVKLEVPSGFTDDWGQTGLCVPTRE
jgi:hypothetical protein